MNRWLAYLLEGLPLVLIFAGGFGMAWNWQANNIDALTSAHAAEIARLHEAETKMLLDQAALWRAEIKRKADLADVIDTHRVAENARQARELKETKDALKAATTGRPCLGGAALRLLDQPAGLRPAAGAESLLPAGALQDRAARPAADPAHQGEGDGDEYATDTDIAGWIATARDLYEQCRGRLDDIRRYDDGGGQ
jgi:hypothetical protein